MPAGRQDPRWWFLHCRGWSLLWSCMFLSPEAEGFSSAQQWQHFWGLDWNYYSSLPLPLRSLLFLQSRAALLAVWDLYKRYQNSSLGWSLAGPLWYPWWDRKGASHTNRDRQRVRIWVTHETNALQTTFLPVDWRYKKSSFASSARTSLAFLNCNFSVRCCSVAGRLHAKNFHYLLSKNGLHIRLSDLSSYTDLHSRTQ